MNEEISPSISPHTRTLYELVRDDILPTREEIAKMNELTPGVKILEVIFRSAMLRDPEMAAWGLYKLGSEIDPKKFHALYANLKPGTMPNDQEIKSTVEALFAGSCNLPVNSGTRGERIYITIDRNTRSGEISMPVADTRADDTRFWNNFCRLFSLPAVQSELIRNGNQPLLEVKFNEESFAVNPSDAASKSLGFL